MSVSLEMLGDPAALDTLARARRLATGGIFPLRMAASQVWQRVKFGAPEQLDELRDARELADSLLDSGQPASADEAAILSELAALLGRPTRSAELARQTAERWAVMVTAPPTIDRAAASLWAFAAVGYPRDSIDKWEQETEALIRNGVRPEERDDVRVRFIEMAAILSFPELVFRLVSDPNVPRAPIARAQAFLQGGDAATARRTLDDSRAMRRDLQPGEVSIDIVFAEARLRAAMGDSTEALSSLQATLSALRWIQPGMLDAPGRAGPLVRSMILLAELAASAGHVELARSWANAVHVLWGDAEASAAPLVARMTRIGSVGPTGQQGGSHEHR
jgi:hypothetical protein